MIKWIFGACILVGMNATAISDQRDAAFRELCEEVGDCPRETVKETVKTVIQTNTVYIPVPVAAPVEEAKPKTAAPAPEASVAELVKNTPPLFDNSIVRVELLSARVAKDNRTVIVQLEVSNKLNETIWLDMARSPSEQVVSDGAAQIWNLTQASGLNSTNYPKTRFSPHSKSMPQLVYTMANPPKSGEQRDIELTLPLFLSGKLLFKSENERDSFAFGFNNITPL